jgi:hypothetical protein
MTSKKFERIANYCIYVTSIMDLGEEIKNKSEVIQGIMIKHYKKVATEEEYNKVYELKELILKSFLE